LFFEICGEMEEEIVCNLPAVVSLFVTAGWETARLQDNFPWLQSLEKKPWEGEFTLRSDPDNE